jgi:hypothetical protein
MGIDVHQIHNLVRTYQHALRPIAPANPTESVNHQDDRVSFSAETRERHEPESAIPERDRDNMKRAR